MRKSFVYAAGLMCLALSITDCQKELVDQTTPASEPNFELFAQPVTTKTANNGLDTKWVANDAINVFHAEAGSTLYFRDNQFTVKDIETGRFDGTVSKSLSADKSYDWYAFYPYSSYNKTPAGISKDTFGYTTIGGTSQTQTGNGSRVHLAGESCPLYGIASNVASDKVPSISMNHLTSVIKVSVTNNSGEDLTVSSVSFTGTEDIVGTYFINFAASPVAYKSSGNAYVSSTASLTVSNGEALANGSSADFYIALKPFTAKTGSTLKLAVNGYEKTLTLKNDITFTAGHIKPLNFNYDKKNYVTVPWVEDFSGALDKYTLVNGGTDTKTYAANLAKGAAPELLVSKNGGSFTAKVKIENNVRDFSLTFLSNRHDLLDVKSDTEGVNFTKSNDGLYYISVPADIDLFTITFYNSTKDNNYRLDNISLVEGGDPRTNLEAPKNLLAMLNEDTANVTNSIDVVWDAVENAGAYVVTATPIVGDAVVKTVEGGEAKSCTITGLAYETEYTISIYAKPSDTSKYKDSAAVSYEEVVKTGAKPAGVVEEKVLIIDASKLSSTATTKDVTYTYQGVDVVFSKGAKQQGVSGSNAFNSGANSAILIGKSGSYIYNKTAISGVIKKFEIFANGSASAKVSVGVNFSSSAITKYDSKASNTYAATLSTVDHVYDCSSKLPADAKYFWYQVTSDKNSQVQFRITYVE